MPFAFACLMAWAQADPEILRHVERLGADDLETRERAAATLRSIGDASIPALEAAAATADQRLRIEIRKLLRDLSATSALVEDLGSDDIPGNARAARAMLRRRYGPKVRDLLVDALKSNDDQKAVQAAFILITQRDRQAVDASDTLVRAARAIALEKAGGYRWVAAEVVVSLGATLDDADLDKAWARALDGVDPSTMKDCVLDIHQVSARSKTPLPGALVRHYLRNLMNDNKCDNARQCSYALGKIGPDALIPELRQALNGYDSQARSRIVGLLLQWNQDDVPPEHLVEAMGWSDRALGVVTALGMKAMPFLLNGFKSQDPEVVLKAVKRATELEPDRHDPEAAAALSLLLDPNWNGDRAKNLLRTLGTGAESALLKRLDDEDSIVAFGAARGLIALDPERHADRIWTRLKRELVSDARRDNARRASQILFEWGDQAAPRLRSLVDTSGGQPLVCAAAILARRGLLGELPHATLESLVSQAEESDEPGAFVEFLHWSEAVRRVVLGRLEWKSPSKADALRSRLLTYREDPWLKNR